MCPTNSVPTVVPEASPYPICEHIKITGERCGSPALRGETLCYYHGAVRKRVPKNNLFAMLWNPHVERTEKYEFEMPYPEDPESLQIAFSQFIHAVSQDLLKYEHAKLLLSALHGAAANLRLMAEFAAQRQSAAAKKPAVTAPSSPQNAEQTA